MKKGLTLIIALLLALPMALSAQTYSKLWESYDAAMDKDLPRSAIEVLDSIAAKAEKEKKYGHYYKALVERVKLREHISYRNIITDLQVLDTIATNTTDTVARAVMNAVMYHARNHYSRQGRFGLTAEEYRKRAMEHPHALAAARSEGYSPLIIDGKNSDIFGGDMLSVIGIETGSYKEMLDYYTKVGNRRAACMSKLLHLKDQTKYIHNEDFHTSEHVAAYDSLISQYADVDVVAEAAIERCLHICDKTDATAAEKVAEISATLKKYDKWQTADRLVNTHKKLIQPGLKTSIRCAQVSSTEAMEIHLANIRNIPKVKIDIRQLSVDGNTGLTPNNDKDYKKLIKQTGEGWRGKFELTYEEFQNYDFHDDTLRLPPLPVGVYLVEFTSTPKMRIDRMLFHVSDVRLLAQQLPDNKIRYIVVDAISGQPQAHAKLDVEKRTGWNKPVKHSVLNCDENGEVIHSFGDSKPHKVFPYTETDRFALPVDPYTNFSFYDRQYHDIAYGIFTDRSIYRPGQTVKAGIVAYRNGEKGSVVKGEKVRIVLHDSNHNSVGVVEATTDKFGGASAEFALPTDVLTGYFEVTVNDRHSESIRVEEYKRPTFRVEMPEVDGIYKAGDTLRLQAGAESFGGFPVQHARVEYTVKRSSSLWWRYYSKSSANNDGTICKTGSVVTDEDGRFMLEIPLTIPEDEFDLRTFYNFTVEASVTDLGGETQRGTLTIPLSFKDAFLNSDIQERMLADSTKSIRFTVHNAAGKELKTDVTFRFDNEQDWRTASTEKPYMLTEKLPSGKHCIVAIAEGDTLKQEFTLFGLDDKRPCATTDEWFYTSGNAFRTDGKPVTVQVGASDKDIHVVYTMTSGKKLLESGSFQLSDSLHNRKLTYRKEYGDGILLTYAWMKNGRLHTYNTSIKKPLPDTGLRMKWTTFRDRLAPGTKEEWQLSITNPDGTPAEARLIATLYDKSLDMLKPHQWHLQNNITYSTPNTYWEAPHIPSLYYYASLPQKYAEVRSLEFARFYGTLFADHTIYLRGGAVGASKQKLTRSKTANVLMESVVAMDTAAPMQEESASEYGATTDNEDNDIQLREDFSETAFFAPSLMTNKDGEAVLKFTLPESVTTWRFMGIAHTKNMFTGSIEGEAVATKTVMVQPNIPRFIRTGDKASISTRIVNLADKQVSGVIKITLYDPETSEIVHERTQEFKARKNQTTAATFTFEPTDKYPLLACRITAEGENFSDGEQHYIPVLPDMEMVTKTVPITMHKPGTKTVDIKKLFPTVDKRNRLTVEYTEDPSWLVIQALPTVGTPREKNAIEQCAAFYANSIAAHLIEQRPQIKAVFEAWMNETAGMGSLESPLSKNQELKDIVLDETPWVNEARFETEQKHRLADFFNNAKIDKRLAANLKQLKKLQNGDGSWSWWEGMGGSTYMTIAITEMLTRLNMMTGYQPQTAAMLDKAYGYIDNKLIEFVKEVKAGRINKKSTTYMSMNILDALYITALRYNATRIMAEDGSSTTRHSSSSSNKPSAELQAAIDFIMPQLEKDKHVQTIYAKAKAAIVLDKFGRSKKSLEFVKSLKEYTVATEEMGRYYETGRAQYSWMSYTIPTQVMAIETIRTVTPADSITIEEMQRWLLQEKRTQLWGNAINNANTIYAFLGGVPKEIQSFQNSQNSQNSQSSQFSQLSLDGQPLDMPQGTVALGYTKTSIDNPTGKELTFNKTSQGTSWGAVYAQFMQKTKDIEAHGSDISVKREILLSSQDSQNSQSSQNSQFSQNSQPSTSSLKVGTRITVRITIEASRDLDFVQVSDRRAACMEPVEQLSGYHWRGGYYRATKDNATNYFFDKLRKGTHIIETEYTIDRAGIYETGTCTAGCAYAPEFRATAGSQTITVK